MILARCPHCETTFRATAEALKARAGKVRCGKCRKAFNALEHLIEETPDVAEKPAPAAPGFELVPPPAPPLAQSGSPGDQDAPSLPQTPVAEAPEPADETTPEGVAGSPPSDAAIDVLLPSSDTTSSDPLHEAQSAGLVAARETSEIPGYSKWSAGTFAGEPAVLAEHHRRSRWLYVLLIVLLGMMAAVQATYLYRVEIASRWPETRPWLEEACAAVACTVPYPTDADQIDIHASELQSDPERGGLLVLHLTLQNRSEIAQAYPSIELTLTDIREQVVVRRVLAPADWLPAKLENRTAFPARGEIAARIWIDPKDTGAAGYSLQVVYP